MGGGKKFKLDKAFKPLRDKFDKTSQEKKLVFQKLHAKHLGVANRGAPRSEFDQQARDLKARMTGPKKVTTKRAHLVLKAPTFYVAPPVATAQPEEGSTHLKYSADRYLEGEIAAKPKMDQKVSATEFSNRFTLLEEEEEKVAPLSLKPAMLPAFVPLRCVQSEDDDDL